MASGSSTPSSLMEHSQPLENPIPPPLKFVMNSIKTISNTPLTAQKYLIWSAQIQKLFRANGFSQYLDGSSVCPPKFLHDSSGVLQPNPAYNAWQLTDQNLSAAIFSTISPQILPYVLNLETTTDIWHALARRLQATNRSRIIQLKNELHLMSMKGNSMSQYLSDIKAVVDQLTAAGTPVDHEDVILYTLNGLPSTYQSFKIAIRTRLEPIPLEDFYSLLCSEETNLSMEASKDSSAQIQAFYASRGRSSKSSIQGRGRNSNRGRSNSTNQRANTQSSSPITCQICAKIGHSAKTCWYRHSQDAPIKTPTALAANPQQSDYSNVSDEWFLDSGASAHLTSNLHNLHLPTSYSGSDTVTVGNGSTASIAHSGQSSIQTPRRSEDKQSASSRSMS